MPILIIVLIAGVAGFFLARSRYSQSVDEAASKVATSSRGYANQASAWAGDLFGRRSKTEQLRAWVAGPGAADLPEDFKSWLAGLPTKEADEFTNSLDRYASGLGYDLDKLVKGELDSQPSQKQAFAEALAAYSQTYRKADEARQVAGQEIVLDTAAREEQPPAADGKPAAEKTISRRRSDTGETSESSPAS